MEFVDYLVIAMGLGLILLVIAALIKGIRWGSKGCYDGELRLNNTNPDEPPYTLFIGNDCHLDEVDEIVLRVTRK